MSSFTERRKLFVAAGAVVVAGALAALTAAAVKPPPLSTLKGSISADGSSTVGPYTIAAAEAFRRGGADDVRVTVGISGTGGGFSRFCEGETDISNASRPMKRSEAQACKKNRIPWRAFAVANDALTVVVHPQNTWAACLTTQELKKIWEPGSEIDNWREVRPSFPNKSLKLYGPGTDSGTFDYFTETINGEAQASRSDFAASEDDNVVVQGVAADEGALGYFGFSYYEENQDRLKAVRIRNPKTNKCVAPSKKNVWNGTYKPLARPLFIYVKGTSFKRSEVRGFIRFMLANERVIARKALFIPLTKKQLRKARVNFALALSSAKNK